MRTKINLLKFSLSVLLISFLFTSCKKDEIEEGTTITNSIKMKIDNNAEITYKDNFSAMVLGNRLIIGASNTSSGGDIQFSLDPSITSGTYSTGFLISHGVNGQAIFTTLTNASNPSLTITIHDTSSKHIKGTFSLNFTDNTTQANRHAEGSFDVKYN